MSYQSTSPLPVNENSDGLEQELPKYMSVREGVYYFKRRIPAKVIRALKGKGEQVWISLGTSSLEVAIQKLAIELRAFDALVASAEPKKAAFGGRDVPIKPRGEGTTKYLLEEHIPSILSRFEYGHLSTDDEERKGMSREDRAERLEMLDEGLMGLYELAAAEDYSTMDEVAEQLLSIERLIAPPGSFAHQQLLKLLLMKDIEVMQIQRDRLKGKMTLTPKTLPLGPRELPTLLDLVKAWSAKQTEVRTIDMYMGAVQEFEALYGALPVVGIKSEHVEAFIEHLARGELARETVKNRVGALATLVRYGGKAKLCSILQSPFEDVSFDDVPERPAFEDRRAYEVSELVTLLQSPLYTQGPQTRGQAAESSYWAPLMGPFVGARIEEIAQLRVEDVQCINGVWALRIANLDAQQHLKTDTSYRIVPLHEEVIRCGFLAYVAKTQSAGYERIFPSQRNNNKYKRWSNALGKWYSGYLDSIGLTDERLCYHSFRFTFKQRCTLSGVETETRDALTGHWLSKNDASRGYMKAPERQYPFPALVSAIKKLRYDELDLSHLYVAEPLRGMGSVM